MELKEFLKIAANVKPDKPQLERLRETPFYAFVHFSPNTYTNLEWGDGTEDPAIFNPTELDCEQWVKAIKSAGMKGLILTAKHHDGFCLWQTKYTEHSMKNSPYKNGKGDIVKECADACKKHGIKFGFYLSPWDRNSALYGTDEYNDYYVNQLTELLTNYGEIFHVWFDNACGEGPNGKKQVYDFDRYIKTIRKYQPNATFFNDKGGMRWCGNEAGAAAHAQWCVVPYELCSIAEHKTEVEPLMEGSLDGIMNSDTSLGSIGNIMYSKALTFCPAETDMSIRPGWFYHEDEEPNSLDRLFNTYLRTVGGNTTFNLNIPPMKNGKFNEKDIKRLKELGDKINSELGTNLAEDAEITENKKENSYQTEFIVKLKEKQPLKYIELAEAIAEGQKVESFKIYSKNDDNLWNFEEHGTTIGSRKIVALENVTTDEIKVQITSARDVVKMDWVKVF
ncbi:MAG: alpha-fucosidase [Ruminococcaceae bacterium]|nr:alpha-fucosidase [Oscillospiraceae bacterium]